MDFVRSLTDALAKGTPWAVLIAAVGALWQIIYVYSRDRSNDRRSKAAADLEGAKFEYQKSIEELKFSYEQRRWREQLATQLALKHVETRLTEYSSLWSRVEIVAKHRMNSGKLTPNLTQGLAEEVRRWRYSTGGLLAENTTRDAVYTFQQAVWDYDQTSESYKRIRAARRILRDALRSDMGVSEDMSGKSIIDVAAERQRIRSDLTSLQAKLGIKPDIDQ
jgi:hypothetical protein